MAPTKEAKEEKQSLPIGHPQAAYISPDLSLQDGVGTLPDEEQEAHDEQVEAQQAEAEAAAEHEDKVAKAEAQEAEAKDKEAPKQQQLPKAKSADS
jgi:hypothetical protein